MKNVVIYTKNNCGYCIRAKQWMEMKGHDYSAKNIDEDEEAMEFAITERHRTMPQIYIDGEHIGGYSELIKKYGD